MNQYLSRYRGLADPLRSERRVELLLVLLVLVLLVQLAWALARSLFPAEPQAVQPTADAMRVVSGATPPGPDLEQRAELRNRPLFWDSRRPLIEVVDVAPPQVAAAEDKPEEVKIGKIKDVTLKGVFGSGESAGIIYLAKGKEHRIMVGESVNGWELETVELSRAVFRGNGKSAELDLKRGTIEIAEPEGPAAGATSKQQAGGASGAKAAKSEPEKERTLSLGNGGYPARR